MFQISTKVQVVHFTCTTWTISCFVSDYHDVHSFAHGYFVCDDFTLSTMSGIFATEVDPARNYDSRYGSMQLNYHEGEYLSSLGNTMFGGAWTGTDSYKIYKGVGLIYLWHSDNTDVHGAFSSLSQWCHSSDTWAGNPVVGGSTWSSGIWGKTQRMRGLCEEYIAAASGSSLDWGSLNWCDK